MNVLIDNIEKEFLNGYVQGIDITGRKCNASYHIAILDHQTWGENFKLAGNGHVYVINYNKKTFVEKYPMTFEEYIENGNKF